jgi:hypothetical protein
MASGGTTLSIEASNGDSGPDSLRWRILFGKKKLPEIFYYHALMLYFIIIIKKYENEKNNIT